MGVKGPIAVLFLSLAAFSLKSEARLPAQTFPESSKRLLTDTAAPNISYSSEKRNSNSQGNEERSKNKLDCLQSEMEKYRGESGNLAYDYLKMLFDSAYSGKIDSLPDAGGRVDALLQWLAKKPGLLGEFVKNCNDGKVAFTSQVSESEDLQSSLAVFGFWMGLKYAGETMKERLLIKTVPKFDIEELDSLSGSIVGRCREDSSRIAYFGRINTLDSRLQSFLGGYSMGIHEFAHGIRMDRKLSESAAAFLQWLLALPVPLFEPLESGNASPDVFQAGRRDFYDIYLKSASPDPVSSKNAMQWMMIEYPEFAVYPWIKGDVKIWRLQNMHENGNYAGLDSMGALKRDLGGRDADPDGIAAEICKRYCINDNAVKDSLSQVFSRLSEFERGKTRSSREFLEMFITLMNRCFGKPAIEIWREFTLLNENGKMKNG